ncbi:hypothetical protein [Paraburkholderia sp. D1E]|uniref:hypothetical protein n=1 Tax=Paraburkholderia sp. D1E TaxID=3461398 RepID=UPI004046597D
MGLLKNMRSAITTGTATARGDRVADEIQTIMNNLSAGSQDMREAVFAVFLARRAQMLEQRPQWNAEQQTAVGKNVFEQAKMMSKSATSHHDEATSYGIGLAGLWLESGASISERAQLAHQVLESMING